MMRYSGKFFHNHKGLASVAGICLLLFVCGFAATEIIFRQHQIIELSSDAPPGPERRTILSVFIGQLENLIGDMMILKADVYLHGMLSYTEYIGEKKHHGEQCHALEHNHHEHAEADHHDHHHESGFNNFFFKKYQKVRSSEHVHIDNDKELAPWLAASTRLNPHNIRAFLIGAYWVGHRMKKWDEAEKLLREGIRYNSKNWQLRYELGNLYTAQEKYQQALAQYVKAEKLFPQQRQDELKLELCNLWRSTAGAYEKLTAYDKAIAAYRKILELNPTPQSFVKFQSLEKMASR